MVLVIDDDCDIGNLLVVVMRSAEIESEFVLGGPAALTWLSEHRPSLIILDVNMPGMSGLEFLKVIKADPQLHNIPVVMHTALDDGPIVGYAKDLGAVGTLFKGRYNIDEITNMVNAFTLLR